MRGMTMAVAVAAGILLSAGCGSKSDTSGGSAAKPEAEATSADASVAGAKAQTKCPVMGGKIVKTVYADHDGKRVYFCCKGCDATFKKDPAKYITKLEDAGVVIAKTPSGQ